MQYPASSCQPFPISAEQKPPCCFPSLFPTASLFQNASGGGWLPRSKFWTITFACLLGFHLFPQSSSPSPGKALESHLSKMLQVYISNREAGIELNWQQMQNCRGGKSAVDQFTEGLVSSHGPDVEAGKWGRDSSHSDGLYADTILQIFGAFQQRKSHNFRSNLWVSMNQTSSFVSASVM